MNTKETKHSPGKWRYSREFGEITTAPLGIIVGSKSICRGIKNQFKDTEECEANALLIAAAPDMFEALEYAQQILSTARKYFPKSIKNSDRFSLENANAAVGKALRTATHGTD